MKRLLTIVCLLLAMHSVQAQPVSQKMAATVMTLWKDSFSLTPGRSARWSYDQGVFLKGFEGIWKRTGDPKYFDYIQKSMDFFVDENGTVKGYRPDEYNIDHVNNARILLLLFRVTGKEKYWKAATHMRNQLRTHPRTAEGGFWHKQVYPHQMWLDGLYMGQPFYAEYTYLTKDDTAFNDIAKQFILMEKHARDAKTGLLYHGWDESKQQKWANKETGVSPNFWARAMGWYAMGLVDVLDYFPESHPKQKELVAILQRLAAAIQKVQDPKTGVWFDLLDKPTLKGNYVEASASSMFVYAVAKGIRKGYLAENNSAWLTKAYDGLVKQFIVPADNGGVNLNGTVTVSGLGGSPNYRDGSDAYYLSERVIQNDPKGIGAFLHAANEMEMRPNLKMGKGTTILLDNYFNNEVKKDITGDNVSWHYTWDEMNHGGFSLLGNLFEQHGAKLATLKSAPTAANLRNAGVYIIVDPDTQKESPRPNYVQPGDVTAISDWVRAGGILALFSNDSSNAEFTHFNTLAEKFGFRFNPELKNPVINNQYEQGAIVVEPGNPVFKTAKKVYIKELASLKVAKPTDAGLKHKGDNIVAVVKYGKGWVFAVGDPWFYNEYIDGRKLPAEYENFAAASDFVKWVLSTKNK
ncbi:glycoside hydrolase family 88 protein [Segetibacter sp. 3557_3]|uniref:glycoside hydrolase family 88 protein n=1 Tax=Segetibacter sp. 3557_3 TaxID=2547429 RepID=UPI00105905B8|nr:glycoside hydrolase family 88 protein [Segetibacter sp. 3557_3]TDH27779.1 glycoside hydrolase family 88 protein [Segetibacter sp. 3557_3]